MLHAVDVSHHQDPSSVDWTGFRAAGCDVAFVRLTYGTMIDRKAAEHAKRARDAGFVLGAYLFFRPTQPIEAQRQAFYEAALLSGYGRPDDVVPALDIEDDTQARPIKPEFSSLFEEMAQKLRISFDCTPMAYITQRDWGRLGKPAWVLSLPLWVAHYAAPSRLEPATPAGLPWAGWQHRVGRFQLDGPNGYYNEQPQIDQNRFRTLRFIDGNSMSSPEPEDADIVAQRSTPDTDGTEVHRANRFADQVRAWEATENSAWDALERSKREQLMGGDDDPNSVGDPDDEITTPDGKGNA